MGGVPVPSQPNWPLLNSHGNIKNNQTHWPGVSALRQKSEPSNVLSFLSPQGPLFTALRQSADAWVSVAFDSKMSQSDSVRMATGTATIMRQPKLSSSQTPYRSQRSPLESQQQQYNNEQMITLPVPHYFILRLVSYLTQSDVLKELDAKSSNENYGNFAQSYSPNQQMKTQLPSCIYTELIEQYCDFLLLNAKQPPGSTLATSRSLCADLARLFIQAVADFWLTPYLEPSSNSFSSTSPLPPPVVLLFIQRFLKRYFYMTQDDWIQPRHQSTFVSLKQPLLQFLHNCMTHWPLNITFSHVVSCWRCVVLPWRSYKKIVPQQKSKYENGTIWESYVHENPEFYSDFLLIPMIQHFSRANVICPTYASAVLRMSKVFGSQKDTEMVTATLITMSSNLSTTTNNQSMWNHSQKPLSTKETFVFPSSNLVATVNHLLGCIDSITKSSSNSQAKDMLLKSKQILTDNIVKNFAQMDLLDVTLNRTPVSTMDHLNKSGMGSESRLPNFRRTPTRQQSFSLFGKDDSQTFTTQQPTGPRSSDIPLLLRIIGTMSMILQNHVFGYFNDDLRKVCETARFRWLADRRELAVFSVVSFFAYLFLSRWSFYLFVIFMVFLRAYLSWIVHRLEIAFDHDKSS